MPAAQVSLNFIWAVLTTRWYTDPYPTHQFTGKTILITGANTGLGLEAARHFTRLNAARVILACRNLEKATAAQRSIETSTLRLNVVEVWHLDMASFASVMEFVGKVQSLQRLDVAVLNAGFVASKWCETEDGWEESMQVNVLSTVLLALHLVVKMAASGREHPGWTPRLSLLASQAHELTRFEERGEPNVLRFLNRREYIEDPVNLRERYPITKLFVIYCGREIAKLVPVKGDGDPEVIVNIVHPGFCNSELGRDEGIGYAIGAWLLAKSAEQGGRTLVDGAVKGRESHGGYLEYCRVSQPAPVVTSEEGQKTQKKVWAEVLNVLNEKYPGMVDRVLAQIASKAEAAVV